MPKARHLDRLRAAWVLPRTTMTPDEAWAEVLVVERELAKLLSQAAAKRRHLRWLMAYLRNQGGGDDQAA